MRQYVDIHGHLFGGRLGDPVLCHDFTASSSGSRYGITLRADSAEELEALVMAVGGKLLPEAMNCVCYGAAMVVEVGPSDCRAWEVVCRKCKRTGDMTRGGPDHAIGLWNRSMSVLCSLRDGVSPSGENGVQNERQ